MKTYLLKNISVVTEEFSILENVNILVENGEISYIGSDDKSSYADEIYEGSGKLALPGLYNTHCHVPMTLLRGRGEGLCLQEWLFDKMIPFEAKLTPEDMYWATLHGAMEMIRSGVCSFTDMYFEIDRIADACEKIGIKANLCHGIGVDDETIDIKDLKGYKDTEKLIERYKNNKNPLIIADCGLHAEYTSCENIVKQVASYAKERNLIVHTHVSETEFEVNECKKRHNGMSPIEYFNSCGLFENKCILAHCVHLAESDYIVMANSKDITVSHNISSNLKLGSGFCDVKKLIDNKINVSIGTDGAASNNNLNMLEEIHLAAMVQKGLQKNAQFMTAKQSLELATTNGAKSQGRINAGSIKVGNRADIFVVDMQKTHLQPIHDALANIIFSAEASDIVLNMIDGNIVYKDGEYLTIDSSEVLSKIIEIKERIVAAL